jgi:hypothetical protein
VTALTYAIVTPSYWRDVDRCALLLESVARHVPGDVRHYVVVARRDVPLFGRLRNGRWELIIVEDIVPRWLFRVPGLRRFWVSLKTRPVKNWILQQIVKLSVPHAVHEDVLLYADSDMFFVRPYDPRDYERAGRVPLFAETGQKGLIPSNDDWQQVAARLLGIPPDKDFDTNYVGQLVCWRRANATAMLTRVEQVTGRPWQQAIAALSAFSEYILYGVYVDRVCGENSGHWRDALVRNVNYWGTTPLDIAALESLRDLRQEHHHSVMVSSKSETQVDAIRQVFFST